MAITTKSSPTPSPQAIPIPSLQGLPPQKTEEFLRTVAQTLNRLNGTLPDTNLLLTKSDAAKLYSPSVIRRELQAGGTAPLNLTSLPGTTAQAQSASIPLVNSLPTSGPLLQDGVLISFNGVLYRFNATPAPGSWVAQGAIAVVLEDTHANRVNFPPANYPTGTLYCETDRHLYYIDLAGVWTFSAGLMVAVAANRPLAATLGVADTNLMFLASDTLLFSYWSGVAWVPIPVNTAAAGTFGDGTHVSVVVVDANGRITSVTQTAIAGAPPTGAAGGDLGGSYPNPNVLAVNGGAIPTNTGAVKTNGFGQFLDATGFTGTLAAAIAGGKNVVGGIIQP